MKLDETVFLIGFSGSGKSSVGSALARKFQVPFVDTDVIIEKNEGRTISEIFAQTGERYFRNVESGVIQQIVAERRKKRVVALGGGAFESRSNRELILSAGLTVYLSCSVREIYRRLSANTDRPLLWMRPGPSQSLRDAKLARITMLIAKRRRNYRRANIRYATSRKDLNRTVKELSERIEEYYA